MSGTLDAHRREMRRKLLVGLAIVLFAVPVLLVASGEALHLLAVMAGAGS